MGVLWVKLPLLFKSRCRQIVPLVQLRAGWSSAHHHSTGGYETYSDPHYYYYHCIIRVVIQFILHSSINKLVISRHVRSLPSHLIIIIPIIITKDCSTAPVRQLSENWAILVNCNGFGVFLHYFLTFSTSRPVVKNPKPTPPVSFAPVGVTVGVTHPLGWVRWSSIKNVCNKDMLYFSLVRWLGWQYFFQPRR